MLLMGSMSDAAILLLLPVGRAFDFISYSFRLKSLLLPFFLSFFFSFWTLKYNPTSNPPEPRMQRFFSLISIEGRREMEKPQTQNQKP